MNQTYGGSNNDWVYQLNKFQMVDMRCDIQFMVTEV